MEKQIADGNTDPFKIENGIAKVPVTCSQCSGTSWIDRDRWERYYADDNESEFICVRCQLEL